MYVPWDSFSLFTILYDSSGFHRDSLGFVGAGIYIIQQDFSLAALALGFRQLSNEMPPAHAQVFPYSLQGI